MIRRDRNAKSHKIATKIMTLVMAGVLAMIPVQQAQAVGAGSAIARGIDVSKHNLAIDWGQVPSSGVSFAFVKAGSTYSTSRIPVIRICPRHSCRRLSMRFAVL